MTRRALLPQLDGCVASPPSHTGRRPVSRAQLLQAVYPFIIIALLGILHVHLHLLKTEMLAQTGELQKEQRTLLHDTAFLERSTESFCNTGYLKSVARALNMQPFDQVSTDVYARVPASTLQKYQAPLPDAVGSIMVAQAVKRSAHNSVWSALTNLFDTGRAVASAVRQ